MSKTYRKDPYSREETRDGKAKKSELKKLRQAKQQRKYQSDESKVQTD